MLKKILLVLFFPFIIINPAFSVHDKLIADKNKGKTLDERRQSDRDYNRFADKSVFEDNSKKTSEFDRNLEELKKTHTRSSRPRSDIDRGQSETSKKLVEHQKGVENANKAFLSSLDEAVDLFGGNSSSLRKQREESSNTSSAFPCAKENPKRGDWCDKEMKKDAINGGPWEDTCFTGETLVNTPKGFLPIKKIHLGDSVYSCDESNDVCEIKTVTEIFKRNTSQIVELKLGDELIEVTPNHPVYVYDKGWVPAGDLVRGDFVKLMDGGVLKVSSINLTNGTFTVYNLGVGDYQSLGVRFENSYVSTSLVKTYNENKNIIEVKPIKNIKIGDIVWDNSSESFKYVVDKHVKKTSDLLLIHTKDEFGGKISIKITRDHVFYRDNGSKIHGWELNTGIPLTIRGRLLLITEINTLLGSFNTYKIDVSDKPINVVTECSQSEDDCLSSSENFHNYYVGKCGDGALVHNCHIARNVINVQIPGSNAGVSALEAGTGYDLCSGQKLSNEDRAFKVADSASSALPVVGKVIYQGGKGAYKYANGKNSGSVVKKSDDASNRFNPFKGKTPQEIDTAFREKGYIAKGKDPMNGLGSYEHPETGRKYYIDKGGVYKKGTVEHPHVDVHRMENGQSLEKDKLKFPLGDSVYGKQNSAN